MDCSRCGEAADPGAAFCGNCGQALVVADTVAATMSAPLPAYAVVSPQTEQAEARSMLALILSVLALPAAILPVLGWALALVALGMAVPARRHGARKLMGNVAMGFASCAIILSAAAFVYNITQPDKDQQVAASQSMPNTSEDNLVARLETGSFVDTPCYSLDVGVLSTVQRVEGSCNAQAYNTDTLIAATNALNIEAVRQDKVNGNNLAQTGKEVADGYLRTSLPNLVITSQGLGTFAGSPAYIINGRNPGNVTIQMALILRKVAHGENVFVVAHAINNAQASLSQFETTWEWE